MKSKSIWGLPIGVCGSLAFSGLADAQAYFECGAAACGASVTPWSIAAYYAGKPDSPTPLYTGIDDLNVRGDLFDVTFTTTAPRSSPFGLSSSVAAPGQPLTGVDAGNALGAFYGSLQPPYGGPGGYGIAGDPGPAFVTAFAPAGKLSAQYFGATELWDVAETTVGVGSGRTPVFGNNDYSPSGPLVSNFGNEVFYTTWTPATVPEIDATFAGGGLALMVCGLAVLQGRRPQRLAA